MSEIYNCWQCRHYSPVDRRCNELDIVAVLPDDAICERFQLDDVCKKNTKIIKKKELASARIALIAAQIEWIKQNQSCHDRMVYDSLSTIGIMLKHLSTSIKNTDLDFEMEVVTHE